jgi:hypothetical protein
MRLRSNHARPAIFKFPDHLSMVAHRERANLECIKDMRKQAVVSKRAKG